MMTRMAIPMHLRSDDVVFGHDLEPIGWWPLNPPVAAKLRKLWGKECRVWLDGECEIVGVEKAK